MTTLSYPFTLVAGQPENVNQLNSNLNAVTTWAAGNIDTTNLATSAKPVTILGAYRTISESTIGMFSQSETSGVYFGTLSSMIKSGVSNSQISPPILITFDPTAYSVSGLTTRLRVVASTIVNATAPAINYTYGLYPITTLAGLGTGAVTMTLGTVVSGSTVTRTAPSASTAYQDASADFATPSAGVYALAVSLSGTGAVNSGVAATVRLEAHHI